MRIPLADALAATDASPRYPERLPEHLRINTDTRSITPGDMFLALRGERFDGHAFIAEAFARGASAVIVARDATLPPEIPALIVADTTQAYMALAAVARRMSRARVVAVTGSAGKTTTKELIAQLALRTGLGEVAATPLNENNEIGVSKLFLGLEKSADVVVVELGARHYGEIEPLAKLARPDVAVLTNIGEAHLEIMGSRERLAETKFGIFASGAQPVLNLRDAVSRVRGLSLRREPHWFAYEREENSALASEQSATILVGRERLIVSDPHRRRTHDVAIDLPGEHNLANLAAASAAILALGVEPEALVAAYEGLALPAGRYERSRLGDFEIIFDAYNASMSGTLATLNSFARERAARRIAVLGGMAELGEDAANMHRNVGSAAARSGIEVVLVGGQYVDDLEAGARAGGMEPERIVRFARNEDAADWLRGNARQGDLVLFKASRMYRLEEIVNALKAQAPC